LALMLIATFSVAQTPCEGFSATIVASGYNTTNDGYYQQCVGGEMTFFAQDILLPNGGVVTSVDWYVNQTLQPNQLDSSFVWSPEYQKAAHVSAHVHSSQGCSLTLDLDMPVVFLEVPEPVISSVDLACSAASEIPVQVSVSTPAIEPFASYDGDPSVILDQTTWAHPIQVTGYQGATITNCNQLEHVYLKLRHTWVGDLSIKLRCPNGTEVKLLEYYGQSFNKNFGSGNTGVDYYWTSDATMNISPTSFPWEPMDDFGGTNIPEGNYLPYESFCNLVGCPIDGTWNVIIQDHMGMDTGTLYAISLAIDNGYIGETYDHGQSAANQFSWSSEGGVLSEENESQAIVSATEVGAATVQYTYTNPAGCEGTATKSIDIIPNPTILTLSNDFVYDIEQDNIVTADIINIVNTPYTYTYGWSPADAVLHADSLSTAVMPITEDTWITFTATINELMGCTASDSLLASLPTNAVHLTVFHDANENGVFDAGENTIPYFPVDANELGIVYTSDNGTLISTMTDATSFAIDVDASMWELTTPSSVEVDETEWTGYALQYYFGVKPTANTVVDIDVALSGITAQCNIQSAAKATIFNAGNYYPGGQLVVTLNPLYTFVSSNPQPTSVSGNVLTYEVGPMFYHELKTINLILQNPNETAFGQVTTHTIQGYYRIDQNTLSSVQDSDQAQQTIICAYDPNDKLTHTGTGEAGFINPNTDMEYTINFQNIGNAPATTVVVTDEITELLDITSLQPIAWSHDFVLQVVDNVATFRFEDIQLLGAEQDEELSKGFVRFKIKQQPNLAPATVIENIAEIVFDNNEAIITNTAVNTIITPTGVAEVSSLNLGIYPNPATDVVYWNNNDYRVTKVVNALGMVIAIPSSNGEMQFNVSQLASGTYVLEFEGVDGTMVRKQIIKS
jgi:uncharacterized repeat protein (TIGR01451 family)